MAVRQIGTFGVHTLVSRFATATALAFIATCVSVSITWAAPDKRLNLVTSDYTHNWNPVSSDSYSAWTLTHFTAERLFRQRCLGISATQQAQFVPACHEMPYDQASISDLDLRLKRSCVDGQGRRLKAEDVAFTLDAIATVPHNSFYSYQSRVDDNRRIVFEHIGEASGSSPGITVGQAMRRLSFPVLRSWSSGEKPQDFAQRPIVSGEAEVYSRYTGGPFAVERIRDLEVSLVRRTPPADAEPFDRVSLSYYRPGNLTRKMAEPTGVDIILGWPLFKRDYNTQRFIARWTEQQDNFGYVGFNFKAPTDAARLLFEQLEFRKLFTETLWAIKPMQEFLPSAASGSNAQVGFFIGETFESGQATQSLRLKPLSVVQGQVVKFLANYPPKDRPKNLTLLVSPMTMLDQDDWARIVSALDEVWKPDGISGLAFGAIYPTSPQDFRLRREDGQFDLIFDLFIHGGNPLKYMTFIRPDSPLNYLGINAIDADDIKLWMSNGSIGVKAFLRKVEDTYPVSVVGSFPRRDLFSNSLDRSEANCGDSGQPMPYFAVERWSRKAK